METIRRIDSARGVVGIVFVVGETLHSQTRRPWCKNNSFASNRQQAYTPFVRRLEGLDAVLPSVSDRDSVDNDGVVVMKLRPLTLAIVMNRIRPEDDLEYTKPSPTGCVGI